MGLATKKPHEGLLIVYDQGEGHLLEKLPLQVMIHDDTLLRMVAWQGKQPRGLLTRG